MQRNTTKIEKLISTIDDQIKLIQDLKFNYQAADSKSEERKILDEIIFNALQSVIQGYIELSETAYKECRSELELSHVAKRLAFYFNNYVDPKFFDEFFNPTATNSTNKNSRLETIFTNLIKPNIDTAYLNLIKIQAKAHNFELTKKYLDKYIGFRHGLTPEIQELINIILKEWKFEFTHSTMNIREISEFERAIKDLCQAYSSKNPEYTQSDTKHVDSNNTLNTLIDPEVLILFETIKLVGFKIDSLENERSLPEREIQTLTHQSLKTLAYNMIKLADAVCDKYKNNKELCSSTIKLINSYLDKYMQKGLGYASEMSDLARLKYSLIALDNAQADYLPGNVSALVEGFVGTNLSTLVEGFVGARSTTPNAPNREAEEAAQHSFRTVHQQLQQLSGTTTTPTNVSALINGFLGAKLEDSKHQNTNSNQQQIDALSRTTAAAAQTNANANNATKDVKSSGDSKDDHTPEGVFNKIKALTDWLVPLSLDENSDQLIGTIHDICKLLHSLASLEESNPAFLNGTFTKKITDYFENDMRKALFAENVFARMDEPSFKGIFISLMQLQLINQKFKPFFTYLEEYKSLLGLEGIEINQLLKSYLFKWKNLLGPGFSKIDSCPIPASIWAKVASYVLTQQENIDGLDLLQGYLNHPEPYSSKGLSELHAAYSVVLFHLGETKKAAHVLIEHCGSDQHNRFEIEEILKKANLFKNDNIAEEKNTDHDKKPTATACKPSDKDKKKEESEKFERALKRSANLGWLFATNDSKQTNATNPASFDDDTQKALQLSQQPKR